MASIAMFMYVLLVRALLTLGAASGAVDLLRARRPARGGQLIDAFTYTAPTDGGGLLRECTPYGTSVPECRANYTMDEHRHEAGRRSPLRRARLRHLPGDRPRATASPPTRSPSDYGQRHRAGADAAAMRGRARSAPPSIASSTLDLREHRRLRAHRRHRRAQGSRPGAIASVPVTYVPARNTIFLWLALALGRGAGRADLYLGVNALDYSGYPDCRPEFIAAFEAPGRRGHRGRRAGRALRRCTLRCIELSKAEIIRTGRARWAWTTGSPTAATTPTPRGAPAGAATRARCAAGLRRGRVADPTRYAPNERALADRLAALVAGGRPHPHASTPSLVDLAQAVPAPCSTCTTPRPTTSSIEPSMPTPAACCGPRSRRRLGRVEARLEKAGYRLELLGLLPPLLGAEGDVGSGCPTAGWSPIPTRAAPTTTAAPPSTLLWSTSTAAAVAMPSAHDDFTPAGRRGAPWAPSRGGGAPQRCSAAPWRPKASPPSVPSGGTSTRPAPTMRRCSTTRSDLSGPSPSGRGRGEVAKNLLPTAALLATALVRASLLLAGAARIAGLLVAGAALRVAGLLVAGAARLAPPPLASPSLASFLAFLPFLAFAGLAPSAAGAAGGVLISVGRNRQRAHAQRTQDNTQQLLVRHRPTPRWLVG